MYDKLGSLLDEQTISATGTVAGTAYNLRKGTPPRGLVGRLLYSGTAGAFTATVEESADGTTWYENSVAGAADLATDPDGEIHFPFFSKLPYVRLLLESTGGTVDFTASAQIGISQP